MKVTFDSNVWEQLVSEPAAFPTIREKILDRSIFPYLCQISISVESIKRADRQQFFPNYRPNINVTWKPRTDGIVEGIVQVSPDNESHPGLAPVHLERLLKAREMGFKVLAMINVGTVRSSEIPQDMLATVESSEAYWEYANRSGECSEFVGKMGCGRHEYDNVKKAKLKISDNQYADAVAEWADGESLSAHYAYGCDVFCTNDQGRNAGRKSIFYPSNLLRLKERFKIVVLSPDELVTTIIKSD
jgi:hypothetical protein